jgi:hypothetical protein
MNYCCNKTVDNKYTKFVDTKQIGKDVELHYWNYQKPEILLQNKEL